MALTGASEYDNIAKTFHDGVVILGTLFHAGVSADTFAQHWTEMASPVAESSIVYHTHDEIGRFAAAAESVLVGRPASADSRDELLALKAAVTPNGGSAHVPRRPQAERSSEQNYER
jgi:hypothetical protein